MADKKQRKASGPRKKKPATQPANNPTKKVGSGGSRAEPARKPWQKEWSGERAQAARRSDRTPSESSATHRAQMRRHPAPRSPVESKPKSGPAPAQGPGQAQPGAKSDGRFKESFLHPDSTVVGMVEMGIGCSIWPGAVLRGDLNRIVLGDYVNVQDNCTLHTDVRSPLEIGDYSLIGHNAVLHGCKIGRGCMIGIGSIVLDEAVIGDGAMVTAGCLIRGKTKIPPRALVVSEGGKIRIFERKAAVRLTIAGSLEYVELARRHQKGEFAPFDEADQKSLLEMADQIVAELGLN